MCLNYSQDWYYFMIFLDQANQIFCYRLLQWMILAFWLHMQVYMCSVQEMANGGVPKLKVCDYEVNHHLHCCLIGENMRQMVYEVEYIRSKSPFRIYILS